MACSRRLSSACARFVTPVDRAARRTKKAALTVDYGEGLATTAYD